MAIKNHPRQRAEFLGKNVKVNAGGLNGVFFIARVARTAATARSFLLFTTATVSGIKVERAVKRAKTHRGGQQRHNTDKANPADIAFEDLCQGQ